MRAEKQRQAIANEVSLSDLTDLLLDGENDLKQLFEKPNSFDGAVILADKGWILAASPEACKLLEVSNQSDVIEKHILDFIPSCQHKHIARKIIMRESKSYTVLAKSSDGNEFDCHIIPTVIHIPDHHYTLVQITKQEDR